MEDSFLELSLRWVVVCGVLTRRTLLYLDSPVYPIYKIGVMVYAQPMTTTATHKNLAGALIALGEGETVVAFGKCPEKGCRHHVRLNVGRITEVPAGIGNKVDEHTLGRFPEAAGMTAWTGTAYWLTNLDCFAPDVLTATACPEHGYRAKWAGLKITTHPSTVCDDACTHATGFDCKCSCGGANHGIF